MTTFDVTGREIKVGDIVRYSDGTPENTFEGVVEEWIDGRHMVVNGRVKFPLEDGARFDGKILRPLVMGEGSR